MANLSIILSIVLLSGCLGLGSLVILNNPRSIINRIYTTFVFFIGFWIFSNLVVDLATTNRTALFWSKLTLIGPIFIAPLFLHFVERFPQKKDPKDKTKVPRILKYLPSLLFLPLIFTKYNIKLVDVSESPPHVEAGPLYYPFFLYFVFYVAAAITIIYRKYRREKGLYRNQLLFLLFGSVATVTWGLFTNAILLLLGISEASALGTLGTIFLIASAWYAITRYRFLNVRFVIGRSIYILILALIPYGMFYFTHIFQTSLWGSIFDPKALFTGFFIAAAFIYFLFFASNSLSTFINEKIINPGFDPEKERNKLSKTLSSELDTDKVVTATTKTLHKTISPKTSAIIIFDLKNKKVLYRRVRKMKISRGTKKLLSIIDYWDKIDKSEPIIREEIQLEQKKMPKSAREILEEIIPYMKKKNIAAIFPLNRKVQLNGILLLGDKKDENAYTVQDVRFIESIVANASVAIGRALLYLQVSDFAKNLEKKVKDATKTLEKQARQLKKKNEALEQASQRERDMMDIVGHELRTPATIVKNAVSYLQMLNRMGRLDKQKTKKYIEKARQAIEREIKLINTFLGAAKIEGGQMQFDPTRFSMPVLIKQVVSENKDRAAAKNLKLEYNEEGDKSLPPIFADRTRIAEVLENLISNAIKYTHKGKVTVWCDYNSKDKTLTTHVKDTGMGISKEDQKKLFSKFGRLKNYTSRKKRMANIVRPGGTGLGLYLVKGVIDLHGGEIEVESKLEKGSTFSFTLPLKTKIKKENLLNPIFTKRGEKNLFKKLDLEKEENKDKGKGNNKIKNKSKDKKRTKRKTKKKISKTKKKSKKK